MKKTLLYIFISATLLAGCSSDTLPAGSPTVENQYITSHHGVENGMLTADFWLKNIGNNGTDVLFSVEKISDLSPDNAVTAPSGEKIIVSQLEDNIPGELLKQLLSVYPKDHTGYYIDNQPASADYWNEIINNINADMVPGTVGVRYGYSITNSAVRVFPSNKLIAEKPDYYYYDANARSECPPMSAVAVLHESLDGKWLYIVCNNYGGWVEKDCIAFCNSRQEWLGRMNPAEFLTVTAKQLQLCYDPYFPQLSQINFPMGTKFPLVPAGEIPDNLNNRVTYGNYVVRIPIRNSDGFIQDIYGMIPVSEDVTVGYCDFSYRNMLLQSLKHLGRPYGWAGINNTTDCSGFVNEVFSCFGFALPRSSSEQVKSIPSKHINIEGCTNDKRAEIFSQLKTGDLLYFPGHIMIYLGLYNDNHYVISAVNTIAEMSDGNLQIKDVNSVVISNMNCVFRANGQTWYECITDILHW